MRLDNTAGAPRVMMVLHVGVYFFDAEQGYFPSSLLHPRNSTEQPLLNRLSHRSPPGLTH